MVAKNYITFKYLISGGHTALCVLFTSRIQIQEARYKRIPQPQKKKKNTFFHCALKFMFGEPISKLANSPHLASKHV